MPKSWSEEEKEEKSYSLTPTPETPMLSICIRFYMSGPTGSWHLLTAGALSPLPNSPLGLHLAKHAVWQERSPRIWRRFNVSAVQPAAPCLHVVTSRHGAHLSNFPGSTSYRLKCVQRQDKLYCSGQLLTALKGYTPTSTKSVTKRVVCLQHRGNDEFAQPLATRAFPTVCW
jgi:hypothetical protein